MNLSQHAVIGREGGLPSSQVHRLAQDRFNRLWLAGPSGLCCYDGHRVRTTDRRQGLRCAGLRCVAVSADDRVWIGTDLGAEAVGLDGRVLQVMPASTWAFGLVSCVATGSGHVWLGTAQGLVQVLAPGEASCLGRHLDIGYVRDLLRLDATRLVAVSAQQGLVLVDEAGSRPMALPRGMDSASVRRVARAHDGGLVVAASRRVWLIDRDSQVLGIGTEVPGQAEVDAVAAQGLQVWVAAGSTVYGYLRDDAGALRLIHRSLAAGKVNDLLIDGWGNVWVATDTAGVARISGLRDALQRLPLDAAVFVIRPDGAGGLQVGGDGFAAHLQFGQDGPVILQQAKLPSTVWDMVLDPRDGACWLATHAGLYRAAADGMPERWQADNDLLGLPCRVVLPRDGALWVGTLGGLVRLQDGVAEAVCCPAGLSLGYVYNLRLDSAGRLWIGTLGRGLWREGPTGLAPVLGGPLTASANTYAIAMGPLPGQVLVLQDERIVLLQGDEPPRLVASEYPVAGWAAEWLDRDRVAIGASDGLRIVDCRNGAVEQRINALFDPGVWEFTNNRALLRGPDGRLYCGLNGGLVVVDLAALAHFGAPPMVALGQLQWQGAQATPMGAWTEVDPGKWAFEAEVFCAWLLDEQRVSCQFRLTGFEAEWSPPTRQAAIRYSSLPPGDYLLQAQAHSPLTGPGDCVTLLRLRVRARPLQALMRAAAATCDRLFGLHLRNRHLLQRHAELQAEVLARREAESQLEQHRASLELQVHERTRELVGARDEAQRANRAKSEFLSRMSHELRTPLNAILGFAQLMGLDPAVNDRHRSFIDEMLHAGQHLLALVNDVLDLAQVEAGAVALSLQPVRVAQLVDECLQMIGPAARTRSIRLAAQIDPDLQVIADRTRLRQVLINLLSNAVKYNQVSGWVRVEAGPVEPAQLLLSVVDGGCGIAPERQLELFQPFNRLGAEFGPVEGTGIGLAIVRQLIDLMGGRVGVHSQPGLGSRFWLALPAAAAAVKAVPATVAAPLPAPRQRAATVLYVEDNPANQRIVAHVIARHPRLQLLMAATGLDGLALARSQRPQLVLLDLQLPDMDGHAVMRALRDDARTAAIPVVAVTAFAMPGDLLRSQQSNFVEHLAKPIDIAGFDRMLERWLPGPDAPGPGGGAADQALSAPAG